MKFDFDIAILGGGSAGYACARTAAAARLRAVVVEGGEEVGGLCILRGCMPSKALLYASEVLHLARHASTWGIDVPKAAFNHPRVMARKDSLIREFADYRRRQLEDGRFTFVRARARFMDPHTLSLDSGERLTAGHFVVATGSVVSEPPLPQLRTAGYITSDQALVAKELPKSIIVLGGGLVAVEAAQYFTRLDVRVTQIQRGKQLLTEFDSDAAAVIETVFRREGIELFTGTRLLDAGRSPGGKYVTFDHAGGTTTVEAEEILLALGRTPNTASLDLPRAGVATDGCRIVTNDRMQTSVPRIYAAGDCTGPHEIVHLAVQQGEIAARNIAQPDHPATMDYRLLTSVVFTDPQVAVVGLNEMEAGAARIPHLAASHPFNDHGKSLIMDARDGFVKLIADPVSGEILGGCCVGPVGGELIHEIIAAMAKRMTVHELAAMPHYHPTLAEIWTYPAEELADQIRQNQPPPDA